jgi:hypothetical protein
MDQLITNFVAIVQGQYGGFAKFFLFFNCLLLIPFVIYLYLVAVSHQIKLWKNKRNRN